MRIKIFNNLGLLFLLVFFALIGCEDTQDTYQDFVGEGETVYLGKADSIKTRAGNHRIQLSWLLSDPKVSSYKVYWNNRRDSIENTVTNTAGIDSIRLMIDNISEQVHHFEIITYDDFGNSSIVTSSLGKVYGENYQSTLLQRTYRSIVRKDNDITIEWRDSETNSIGVELKYLDRENELITKFISPTTIKDTLKKFPDSGVFKYRTAFLPEPEALDTFYTDYKEVTISDFTALNVNWDWDDGEYSSSMALSDFGSWTGYSNEEIDKSYISNGTYRVTMLKNAIDAGSGVVTRSIIESRTAYELSFDVKVDNNFDWSDGGGKMGFGLLIGKGYTGGQDPSAGDGASFRLVWGTVDGNPVFRPYIYYVDQTGTYGDTFNAKYPQSGALQKDTWYKIKLFAQSNTGANFDGKAKLTINDEVVYENNNFRWTTQSDHSLINTMSFSAFRGGGDASYVDTDGHVYFDNLKLDSDMYIP